MRIEDARKDIEEATRNPNRETAYARVYRLFTDRPDEVFRKRDVARELTLNYNTVKEVVRQLNAKGKITKHMVRANPPYSFYGLPNAIEKLERSLEKEGAGRV